MDLETIQITLPSSKSLSNRWLMLDYMSRTGIKIKNISSSNDSQKLARLLHQLKAGRRHNFDCRDAATVARFMLALLSITPGTHTLTGSEQLRKRPMGHLINALRQSGCSVTCTGEEGFLPVKIEGAIPNMQRIVIDCSLSSQFASALLLSSATLPQGGTVELQNVSVSEPYIQMTLKVMELAKVNWTLKGNPPVEVVVPASGVLAGVYVQAISAYAPHPNAAKLWMEYLYSDEGQIGYLKGYCHPTRFKDLIKNNKVPKEVLDTLPPAAAYEKAFFPTLDEQAAAKEVITKGWDKVVGANVK